MTINIIFLNISGFLLSKYLPVMSETIGLYGWLSFMSAGCIFGITFVICVMEESRGRNLDSIGPKRLLYLSQVIIMFNFYEVGDV